MRNAQVYNPNGYFNISVTIRISNEIKSKTTTKHTHKNNKHVENLNCMTSKPDLIYGFQQLQHIDFFTVCMLGQAQFPKISED